MTPEHEAAGTAPPHVVLQGVGKRFRGVYALRGVTVSLHRGSVHALVGENGAGKSTLGRVVAGLLRPDEGRMEIDGRPVRLGSPRVALRHGIAMVQQEIALVPQQTALQNVFLGLSGGRLGAASRGPRLERYEALREQVGGTVDADARVRDLRIPEQQQVELMRALNHGAELIVLDEPTASLTRSEVDRLLRLVRQLRERGVTIIYVSHALDEVLGVADTISVLRNGELVRTAPAAGETKASLIESMLGRPLGLLFPPKAPPPTDAPVVASAKDLVRRGAVDGVSLDVRAGEIVALAGLVGSGRSEVARLVAGADRMDSGSLTIDGEAVAFRSPRDAVRAGIALIPESRKDDGLLLGRSIAENIALPNLERFTRLGVVQRRRELAEVRRLVAELDVRPARPAANVEQLSGGNQQKVLFAKWLVRRPRLLLADEPTRGVDVGAKSGIYELIASLAADGLGVLLVSSEIEEVVGLAHRVLVMRRGKVVAELAGDAIREQDILTAALTGGDAAAAGAGR